MAGRKYQVKWIGEPGQFIAGVPASDHEVEGAEARDELLGSGLYELAGDDDDAADEDPDEATEEEA